MFVGAGVGVGFNRAAAETLAAWMAENADFYIGLAPTVDSAANVTSVTMTGKIGGTLTRAGAAGTITLGVDGLLFPSGNSRQFEKTTGLSGTYEGALILLDVTCSANPASTAIIARAENTAASMCLIRMTSGGTWQTLGPNTGAINMGNMQANGTRQVVGFITDPNGRILSTTGKQAVVERDGYPVEGAISGVSADIGLDSLLFGQNFVGKIHQAAIFLIPVGGSLPESIARLWARMAQVSAPVYSSVTDLMIGDGQSLAVGPSITATEEQTYNLVSRYGSKMLDGMQTAAGTPIIALVRPGSEAYKEIVPATGLRPSEVDQNLSLSHSVAIALQSLRGVGSNSMLVANHAIAGEQIGNLDASAVTGTGSVVIFNNNDFWCDQAASILTSTSRTVGNVYKILVQGTADKAAASGYWEGLAQDWRDDHLVDIVAAFPGASPIMVLGQSAGDTNTIGSNWYVCDEQIDLADANGGVLVPEYPFTVADNNVHPGVISSLNLGETLAWAIRTVETGDSWNLGRPTASLGGGTITLTYPAWAALEFSSDIYSGQGITNYGFEVTGATIGTVSIVGNVVTITTSGGTPTAVQYAYQSQNVTAFGSNAYTAHRGLLRTTARQIGPVSGANLYQWAPSFRKTL